MRKKIIAQVFKELAALRQREEAIAQKVADTAFSIPELKECDIAIRLNSFDMVSAQSEQKDISQFEQKEKELTQKLDSLLKKYGYKKSDFEPHYTCTKCKDTGRIGSSYCECFNKLYLEKVKDIANLKTVAPFKFSDFDLSRVSDPKDREFLEATYQKAKTYCKMFSTKKTQNMLLSGATGTGKTCLASAVANELVERGATVIFISAYELLQKMKECHFSRPDDRDQYLDDFLSVDLLVIDDLGVEQILRNITVEYLLLILCERETHGKSTIVTTNLGNQLISRYGDRVASRLTNQKNTLIRIFNGKDMRNSR